MANGDYALSATEAGDLAAGAASAATGGSPAGTVQGAQLAANLSIRPLELSRDGRRAVLLNRLHQQRSMRFPQCGRAAGGVFAGGGGPAAVFPRTHGGRGRDQLLFGAVRFETAG